ncbi:hypothetical protein DRW41_09160 [Neobacillus piezotolerans]|uniref:Transcobalamin-like C-terminal domain-containing protein n=1 Tax=Neobacillus piezotolerans TaxID=2259171 RepID=A0A3D8GQU9_9BACI|nr:DUF4430 domain-containing protein [Neobacillus piezotolerans]RDU36863.1 hypothetical protein DRW41_09160 [Neobacillus piezotolerans]
MARNQYVKIMLAWMLVFALFAGGFGQKAAAAASTVTVKVLGEKGAVLTEKQTEIGEAETAFDALVKTLDKDAVKYEQFSFGKMITEISGLAGTDTVYWGFYINGISAMTGADSYKPQNGDALTFRYESEPPAGKVNLVIAGKDNKPKEFKDVAFIDQPNAFQLLQTVAGPENVSFVQYDFGKMISSINGLEASGTSYWGFYVDGESQMVGAESHPLKDGETVEFKYETFAPPAEAPGQSEPGKDAAVYPADRVASDLNGTIAYVSKNKQLGEWEAIALKQAGKPIPDAYLKEVAKKVADRKGQFRNITDYERYTLGILAAGGNPENFGGYNLVKGIYTGDFSRQGLNGAAYGLIALDSADFFIPADAKWTPEKLKAHLVANQGGDGGWALDSQAGSDPDTTSMVLTALSPYKDEPAVKPAIDKALEYLKNLFASGKVDSSPATAQAVIALSALGLDANSGIITADGKTLLGYLASFRHGDGGFAWKVGDEPDALSTAQGVQALVAYQLYKDEKGSLYKFALDPSAGANPAIENKDSEKGQGGTVKEEGHRLPDTATNVYSLLALGIALLASGGIMWSVARRKRA